jgi:hypothetical protein
MPPELPAVTRLPTSWLAVFPVLLGMALATDEHALSIPPESTAVIATKYRAPVESPVSLSATVSLLCGLDVGDETGTNDDPGHGVLAVP